MSATSVAQHRHAAGWTSSPPSLYIRRYLTVATTTGSCKIP